MTGLLRQLAALFELSPRFEHPRAAERLVLLAIVVVGATLRFHGLGSWGLEGDEKTMALPVMHLVHFGTPLMPSGMFYSRAIGQLYLMAASVTAFGESEWSLRIPSVICGIGLIVVAYFVGRRFLAPAWNVAFVAVTALLPAFIADSQEARMYVFLTACLAGYTALIFMWERTDRAAWLTAAVVVMLIGLQFHTLAVFGGFILFFPGLLTANVRKLWQGGIAFTVVVAGFAIVSRWNESFYPTRLKSGDYTVAATGTHFASLSMLHRHPLALVVGIVVAAGLAAYVARGVNSRAPAFAVALLLFLGQLGELTLLYHCGLVLLLAGAIVAQRHGGRALPRVVLLLGASLVLAVVQFNYLHHASGETLRRTFGMMVGLPSIWPFLRVLGYSPLAWLTVGIGLLLALWALARGRRVPDYWLFFVLAVWLPLFALGIFGWDVEARYTEFALLPMLLCALAAIQGLTSAIGQRLAPGKQTAAGVLVAAAAVVLLVNPVTLARTVTGGIASHPDHKGAAEFIKSLHLQPGDVIVAEDSLQQTYYLGRVDYWLRGMKNAAQFVQMKGGVLRDIYTGAPLIGTGAELMALVERRDRGAIYVIGTGEFTPEELPLIRSDGIYEVLRRPIFVPVFRGRDAATRVWKVAAPIEASARSD